MMSFRSPTRAMPYSDRRRRRIERELRALKTLRAHVRTREIVWAFVYIAGATTLCLLVAAKFHWIAGSLPLSIAAAITAGILIWWIGRRNLNVALLIVLGLLIILAQDVPTDFGPGSKQSRKENRLAKTERAISKREAILRNWDGLET